MAAIDDLVPGDRLGTVTGARIVDLSTGAVDARTLVLTEEGLIAPATPGPAADGAPPVDATGWLALPTLVDAHAHLDKAYTRPGGAHAGVDLDGAVDSWRLIAHTVSRETIERSARRGLQAALASGVTAVRTHVNYHAGDDPLRGIRALVALREEYRPLLDVQVVAMQSHDRPAALIREAASLGPDLLGACPHLTPDPEAETDRVIGIADEFGLGVDLHTDETLDPDSLDLALLAARTRGWDVARPRTASHCVSLAVQPISVLAPLLREVAAAGVGIVVNPLTNLLLQGQSSPPPMPRAVPPVRDLLDAGVMVGLGGDNVQDPFNPLGRGDMWDLVALLVATAHLAPHEAYRVGSAGGRAVMGLPPAGLGAGEPADLVLVRAESLGQALAERAPERAVVRGGRLVARQRSSRNVLQPEAVGA